MTKPEINDSILIGILSKWSDDSAECMDELKRFIEEVATEYHEKLTNNK